MSDHDPNVKGNVAELKIAAEAARLGIPVSRPMTEHERYDLIFELGDALLRVQCKWASSTGEVITVRCVTNRRGPQGFIRTTYTADQVDAIAAYCGDTDTCYLLPVSVTDGRSQIMLRLTEPKNRQRACLNWAAEYQLDGAVAQLGRASHWQCEGRGFESHQLHSSVTTTLGAYEYRQKMGWYMERASGGETFLITRRGKPYARLSPPHEQLIAPSSPPKLEVVG